MVWRFYFCVAISAEIVIALSDLGEKLFERSGSGGTPDCVAMFRLADDRLKGERLPAVYLVCPPLLSNGSFYVWIYLFGIYRDLTLRV